MAESSSNSSSDSLTEQELQLLKKLSKKYEQKKMKEKKAEEKPKKRKTEMSTSQKQAAKAHDKGKELFEFQGWMNFLSLNALCYESLVKEFYGSLKVSGTEAISVKLQGESRELSYDDFGKIFGIPNAGSRVTKIKDVSRMRMLVILFLSRPNSMGRTGTRAQKVKREAEKKKEKGKGKLEEIVKEERKSEEKEEEKKSSEKAEEEEEGTQEEKLEEERKEETEKESTVEKEESEKETGKIEEPEKTEKGKKVEEGSDTETEKLEISDEDKTEQESELLSAQRSREIMLGRIEKELIEEHNKEIDEAIQQCQTIIEQNQLLIKTLGKMKDVNTRKLATLRVKGTTYIPSSKKPKNVKHTAGKHRTHGKKPPLHPSSKRPESSTETIPAQNLRSSKLVLSLSDLFPLCCE
ncbi:hypothetical protein JCGZ_22218 [Jatropha curcas]|uniref:Uncharacterized protein n=1 Tax=Jatropha curcas TaxID=180498 RepID=A0A067JQE3_JATCU|nr:hypothetical protein JCGZ_22218 [Jatropha curcas]